MKDSAQEPYRLTRGMDRLLRILVGINAALLLVVLLTPFFSEQAGLPGANPEQGEVFDTAVEAGREDPLALFGNVRIASVEGLALPGLAILVNGVAVADLSTGEALFRVYQGDQILIDGSAYQRRITLQIVSVSANIDSSQWSGEFVLNGNQKALLPVMFK